MMINLPWGTITYQMRFHHESRSTSAASSSALGTEPSAASVIKIIKGVHIQMSTKSTALSAQSTLVRKSILLPPKRVMK